MLLCDIVGQMLLSWAKKMSHSSNVLNIQTRVVSSCLVYKRPFGVPVLFCLHGFCQIPSHATTHYPATHDHHQYHLHHHHHPNCELSPLIYLSHLPTNTQHWQHQPPSHHHRHTRAWRGAPSNRRLFEIPLILNKYRTHTKYGPDLTIWADN